MSGRVAGYVRRANPEMLTRLIAAVPKEEVDRLDPWGMAAGCRAERQRSDSCLPRDWKLSRPR